MSNIKEYFSSVGSGIASLVKGMSVTAKELVTPKITEQYPENRNTLEIPDRFRAELTLKYDEEGRHKCIGCGICQMNCPNGTINLTTKMVELPDGKKKRKLDTYLYDLGSCTFCMLCVTTCPQDALEFSNDFEQATFTRDALVKKLNYRPEVPDPAPAPKPAAAPAPKPAAPAAPKADAAAAPKADAPAAPKADAPAAPKADAPAAPKAEAPAAPKADAPAAPKADAPVAPKAEPEAPKSETKEN